ncbi:MAG: hypothetical protein WD398_11115 [Cyclobacteriaceae bacterium]
MIYRIPFLLIVLICSSVLQAFSQEVVEHEANILLNVQAIEMHEEQEISNSAIIQQVGNSSDARVIQENNGSQANFIFMKQAGMRNSGYIDQSGSGLRTELNQSGNQNEANLWSIGEGVITSVLQNGNENSINSYLSQEGINKRSAVLIQEGDQNSIDLSLVGNGFGTNVMDQNVRISQFGNQHEVDARMEDFSSSFEITQHPGANGEGMKVNISTSQFNFPMRR